MPALQVEPDISKLTSRQSEIWQRTQGLGEWEGKPQKATEIARDLGVTTNNVYVTRRRVKTILGLDEQKPKRIIHQESNLDAAISSLQAELDGLDEEKSQIESRLEQIQRERPGIEAALDRLFAVTDNTSKAPVAETVAA